jgi:hypothetical protein
MIYNKISWHLIKNSLIIKIKNLINKKLAQNKYENSKAKPKIIRRSNN